MLDRRRLPWVRRADRAAAAAGLPAGRAAPHRPQRAGSRSPRDSRRRGTRGADAAQLPAVFSSSGGDGQNCHEICARARRRRAPALADPLSQLGAQRRRRLLGHRHRGDRGRERAVRLRRELRRGPARGAHPGGDRAQRRCCLVAYDARVPGAAVRARGRSRTPSPSPWCSRRRPERHARARLEAHLSDAPADADARGAARGAAPRHSGRAQPAAARAARRAAPSAPWCSSTSSPGSSPWR